MTKYGGGLLLPPGVIAFCYGCIAGESIFSGGHSQTFGSEIPNERSVGVALDEVLAVHALIRNEEMISEYFATKSAGADTSLSKSTWDALAYGPALFESFWFHAYTGEWMQ